MYASNENEFEHEDGDWVFLRETQPINTFSNENLNVIQHESSNLSFSSNSCSSSPSESNRTVSLSSLSSNEPEEIQNDDHRIEDENNISMEHSISSNLNNNNLSTGEIKEEILPMETIIQQNNETETTPIINEYDSSTVGCDLNNESISSTNNLRQRTGAQVQQINFDEQYPVITENIPQSLMIYNTRPRRNNQSMFYILCILFFGLQFIFCRTILSQRQIINQMTDELDKTNQRFQQIQTNSIENIEQKLTKQFEEKFQKLFDQRMFEYNYEKYSFTQQINELYHVINLTKENLTNSIEQLSKVNQRLKNEINEIERHLQIIDEQNTKENDSRKSLIDALINSLIKQTSSIAEDTSANLSNVFEELSATLTDIVDHRHEYVEESKRKLTDLVGSRAAEQVQMTLRRGVENLSSTIRKAKTTYSTWIRSRSQHRENARLNTNQQESKINRRPWRWTFQRGHDREQMRHQPSVTKKHSSNKEFICHSKYEFPINQLCTMKNWMGRFLRP